jgi:HSP20 family molecular chaperone IbpA
MSSARSGAWMWSEACALLEEAERRHRRFFELLGPAQRVPTWEPPVDVYVLENDVHIVVAMPGVAAEDVELELLPTGLLVRGQSRLAVQARQARIVRLEIPYGRMQRRIELPPGRYQLRRRELQQGCLYIHLAGE